MLQPPAGPSTPVTKPERSVVVHESHPRPNPVSTEGNRPPRRGTPVHRGMRTVPALTGVNRRVGAGALPPRSVAGRCSGPRPALCQTRHRRWWMLHLDRARVGQDRPTKPPGASSGWRVQRWARRSPPRQGRSQAIVTRDWLRQPLTGLVLVRLGATRGRKHRPGADAPHAALL